MIAAGHLRSDWNSPMGDLVVWLLGCLAEDEQVALAAKGEGSGDWIQVDPEREPGLIEADGDPVVYHEGSPTEAEAAHIARHDPARVLAEIETKRRIIELHAIGPCADGPKGVLVCGTCGPHGDSTAAWHGGDYAWYPCDTIKTLALPYADHPDYREEWRPS
jgi:hypothetical protein